MAIPSYLSNVLVKGTNTFGDWFERTNAISSDIGSKVLTAEVTTAGGTTTGNTSLVGIFSASEVAVGTSLRGGTVTTPAALSIVSATTFTANTSFTALETISNHTSNSITANTFILSTDVITATSQTFSLTSDSTTLATANDLTLSATNFIINGTINSTGVLRLEANSSDDAVRITQTGTGNSFVVEDSSSPDNNPFVITQTGTVGIGITSPDPTSKLDVAGDVVISGSLSLGGTEITSTAGELNILDGVTATTSELNILDGVTATTGELNKMDGVTATTGELNIMDGVTATTDELNVLDGLTATTSELNILDGVTVNASQLNSLYTLSGRNLIINGSGQVNQRGYISGTATQSANQFTLDRWYVNTVGQSISFTGTEAGRIMTAYSGGVTQVIEAANVYGGTYCINWVGTATVTVNGVSQGKGSSFTLPTYVNVVVTISGGTFRGVQVEAGVNITPFEYSNYALELVRCQRYYEEGVLFAQGAYASGDWILGVSTTFANEKRVAPTVALSLTTSTGYKEGLAVQNSRIGSVGCNATMLSGSGNFIFVEFTADAELVS